MIYIELLDKRSELIAEMNMHLDKMNEVSDKEIRKEMWYEYGEMIKELDKIEKQMIQNMEWW